MISDREEHIDDCRAIVLSIDPAPLSVRLVVGLLSLPLLAVGLVSLWNTLARVMAGTFAGSSASDLAIGGLLMVGFITVPSILLYGAFLMPGKTLRIDPAAGVTIFMRHGFLGRTRKSFPNKSLAAPKLEFYPEDGDEFARYAVSLDLPDGTKVEYFPARHSLADQKRTCEQLMSRISQLIANAAEAADTRHR